MNQRIAEISDSLQKLVALHRQLLDACALERQALVDADLKAIQEVTLRKQGVVESIQAAEGERVKQVAALAVDWKKPARELTMSSIISRLQGGDMKTAEQLRATLSALDLLLGQIRAQNDDNRRLVERSLEHIDEMKRNVLGEAVPKSSTYNPQGQRQAVTGGSRLISKEA